MRGSAVVIPLQPRTAARQPTTPPGRYERAPGHSSPRTCSSTLLTATTSANATARTGCPAAASAIAAAAKNTADWTASSPPPRSRRADVGAAKTPQTTAARRGAPRPSTTSAIAVLPVWNPQYASAAGAASSSANRRARLAPVSALPSAMDRQVERGMGGERQRAGRRPEAGFGDRLRERERARPARHVHEPEVGRPQAAVQAGALVAAMPGKDLAG